MLVVAVASGISYLFIYDRARLRALLAATGLSKVALFQTRKPDWLQGAIETVDGDTEKYLSERVEEQAAVAFHTADVSHDGALTRGEVNTFPT